MTESELEDLLSTPRHATIKALRACPGDLIVLGAGGKMGPTLARMLVRASSHLGDSRRVLAASRFSDPRAEQTLRASGVETIRCDLLDPEAVRRLPDVASVFFMAGQKFGTQSAPATTWAMNTIAPAVCAERYRGARLVAFSTGNVYPLTPVAAGGARESDPVGPVGEYAWSALGRERVLEYYGTRHGTRIAIVRLNYAIDLRYGVLTDIAVRISRGEPVPLSMGYVNTIWQGDACRIAIECLPHSASPPFVVNVTGSATLSIRSLAEALGERLGKQPGFVGREGPDALLSNTDLMRQRFAAPEMSVERMIEWVADWISAGGRTLGKPTHFEERSGTF